MKFNEKLLGLPAGVAVFAFLALAGLMGLFALTAAPSAEAQEGMTIEYAENGKDPVATFTAVDPEGATPITWSLATSAQIGAEDDLADADNADAASFEIDKDGMLKFSSPPDFENPAATNATNNTYKVVVVACDVTATDCTGGQASFHKVTVMVTKVDEAGEITLATNTAGGTPQYLVGATLTATAKDGDITAADQTFTVDRPGEVTGVTWRWYREGTEIAEARTNSYTLVPDDEGQHIRVVVYYVVAGNVDQEMVEKTTDYTVLAARVGANQLKFDPATVSMTISEGDKDRDVGAPVMVMGNHGTVRYSLDDTSGDALAASPKFKIDEKTGQITTMVDLDYEAAAGDADNCVARNRCTVTVIAADSTGSTTTGTAPNLRATVTIMITDVDETPTFSTGDQTVGVPENSTDLWHASVTGYTATAETAVTYTAADPESGTVNYSLAGPDASKFQLSDRSPILSFVSGPDFEAKASADGDNVYEVTVQASVGGDTGERMVRVTVGNVDEGPEISGPPTRNFVENGKDPVGTYTAVDPEGATSITWSLATSAQIGAEDDLADADNADAGHFTIDKDGMLKFSSPPDFENPSGEGAASNTYKVVVVACDVTAADCTGGQAGFHKVTVTVTKVDEAGEITLTTSTTDGTPQYLVGATLTATAKDGDITAATQTFTADVAGEVSGVVWRWYRGAAEIAGADAQDNTYTLLSADAGHRIRVVATYRVGSNTNQETASLTTDYTVLQTRLGTNELKFDPAAVSREVSEGKKGAMVGAPVTATGNHGTVRYSLADSGDATTAAPRFKIDEKTGQITTEVDLDYEGEDPATATAAGSCADASSGSPDRECTVTVTAFDSTGEAPTNTATVTIMITDVDETPTFSTGAETVGVPENSTDLWHASETGYTVTDVANVTYEAEDPEGRTVNYSLAGPDASKFQIRNSPPVLSFVSKPDFEAKASADGDNVYEVTVQASVGSDTGERMVRVTVGDVDEAPEITRGSIAVSGDALVVYEENDTDAVGTYTARGASPDMATWSLEGDDAGNFMLSSTSGMSTMLMFSSPPDHENPADADGDSIYMVTVKATEGGNTATHDVTVEVTDVDDAGVVTLSEMSPLAGTAITATLTDDDSPVSGESWQWEKSMDKSSWMDATGEGADTDTYTPAEADDGYYLRATVEYTDGFGAGKEASAATDDMVVADRLLANYDANDNGVIDRSDVVAAINRYLRQEEGVTRADVIALINRFLRG